MRIMQSKSKNAISYYVIKDYTTRAGKRSTMIVEKLGTHEELLEKLGGEDPLSWARAYAKELTEKEKKASRTIKATYSNTRLIPLEDKRRFNVSYLFLQRIYSELGLGRITRSIQDRHNFEYNLDSILSRLIYTRILYPSSKRSSYESSKSFIEPPEFSSHQIYRGLEVLCKEQDFILSEVYKNSLKSVDRNTSVLYYDCTNFFFEIEEEDGFRMYGNSKENRPNPLVQLGLFLDGSGFPLAFSITPGNSSEQKTLKPLEEKILKDFKLSKFIVCTDAGLSSYENRAFNTRGERAFVVTQSLKTLKGHLKDWALDPKGWRLKGDNKLYNLEEISEEEDRNTIYYKERWINERGLEQRLIVTYSPKYRAYKRWLREAQLVRAKELIEKRSSTKKKGYNDPSRFIDLTHCTRDGEIANKTVMSLDEERVEKEARYDGFYGLCTNLEGDTGQILKVVKGRWEIEENFSIMKGELAARPVHLSREDRIKAHFLTCFLGLLTYRILERKLDEKYTCSQIIGALRGMDVIEYEGHGWIPAYDRTELTDLLHEVYGFRTDTEIIDTKTMKKIIKETKKE